MTQGSVNGTTHCLGRGFWTVQVWRCKTEHNQASVHTHTQCPLLLIVDALGLTGDPALASPQWLDRNLGE